MPNTLIRYYIPLSVAVSLLAFGYARMAGMDIALVLLMTGLVTFLTAVALERRWPYHVDWNHSADDSKTDLISALVLLGLLEPLLKMLVPLMLAGMAGFIEPLGSVFPAHWPLWTQVLMVALAAEFLYYWSHRWHHHCRPLWWLHALHHGSERLYALNNFRFHPFNHILNHLIAMLPLLLLGVPQEAILGYIALTKPVVLLQHANLDFDSRWLNYVFSTNEVHRWHHSRVPAEANTNFGRGLMVWDQVFGTFRYSRSTPFYGQVGLFSNSRYPAHDTYLRQVLSVFSRSCCH